VAFVIGGTYTTKRLPAEKAAEICRRLPVPVVLLGGSEEEASGRMIVESAGSHVINLCGLTSINQSAAILEKSNLVLTNDTGLMHIAAALRKKIGSFWGNTVPGFGMSPYLPHPSSLEFQVEELKCRPCSKLGFSRCPRGHFRCMNDLDTRQVTNWVNTHYQVL
jgi:ADP-heptose:LPS heptosyltransferase